MATVVLIDLRSTLSLDQVSIATVVLIDYISTLSSDQVGMATTVAMLTWSNDNVDI
jgi:hypothetical protein